MNAQQIIDEVTEDLEEKYSLLKETDTNKMEEEKQNGKVKGRGTEL